MALKFTRSTDQQHQVKLDSTVIAASWVANRVVAGSDAEVEVRTSFVGSGAPIEVTARTEGGQDAGRLTDKIRSNHYRGAIKIKDDLTAGALIYFEVKLPGSGNASGRSNSVPVMLPPKIAKLKWNAPEAHRGDIMVLSASARDVPNHTPCTLDIYEYAEDGAHDLITTLGGEVLEEKIEVRWLFAYGEKTGEIPGKGDLEPYGKDYLHPEFFFVVDIYGFRVGAAQESGRLRFKDFVEFRYDGLPSDATNYEVVVKLPDGGEQVIPFDENGYAKLDDAPAGPCKASVRLKG